LPPRGALHASSSLDQLARADLGRPGPLSQSPQIHVPISAYNEYPISFGRCEVDHRALNYFGGGVLADAEEIAAAVVMSGLVHRFSVMAGLVPAIHVWSHGGALATEPAEIFDATPHASP
jgi:hypothetical protein